MNLGEIIAKRKNKTLYRDGDKTIKVFEPSFSSADVLNEALNLARVGGGTDLNIPKLHAVTLIDGKWALVYDYIEGRSLSDLMMSYPEKHREFLELFVDLQREVHRRRVPLLTKLRDKMHRKIDATDLEATTRYELHSRLEGMPRHNKLCHGDFNTANIILTRSGEPHILDWSHTTQGNASADVARTYLIYSLRGLGEEAEEYLNLFCEKNGTPEEYVRRWLPIVAASQSVKRKPEEQAMLNDIINRVEFE